MFILAAVVMMMMMMGTSVLSAAVRPSYTRVTRPQDCIAMTSTTPQECSIKANKCMTMYNVSMHYFFTPCYGTEKYLGCHCENRCTCT
jgi:hypothetical protein